MAVQTATARSAQPPAPAWVVCGSQRIYGNDFFSLRRDLCARSRRPQVTAELYVLDVPDCVSVVPVTTDGRALLVEQYRHGTAEWVLECPGGSIAAHEDPAAAAARELAEETGYAAGSLRPLGVFALAPSGQSSHVHAFLACDCRPATRPRLEPFEVLRVASYDRTELVALIASGARFHSSTLASLMLALVHLEHSAQ